MCYAVSADRNTACLVAMPILALWLDQAARRSYLGVLPIEQASGAGDGKSKMCPRSGSPAGNGDRSLARETLQTHRIKRRHRAAP